VITNWYEVQAPQSFRRRPAVLTFLGAGDVVDGDGDVHQRRDLAQ
jgi:hypothetical protein